MPASPPTARPRARHARAHGGGLQTHPPIPRRGDMLEGVGPQGLRASCARSRGTGLGQVSRQQAYSPHLEETSGRDDKINILLHPD